MFLEIGGAIVVSPVRCDVLLTLGSVGPTIYGLRPQRERGELLFRRDSHVPGLLGRFPRTLSFARQQTVIRMRLFCRERKRCLPATLERYE